MKPFKINQKRMTTTFNKKATKILLLFTKHRLEIDLIHVTALSQPLLEQKSSTRVRTTSLRAQLLPRQPPRSRTFPRRTASPTPCWPHPRGQVGGVVLGPPLPLARLPPYVPVGRRSFAPHNNEGVRGSRTSCSCANRSTLRDSATRSRTFRSIASPVGGDV